MILQWGFLMHFQSLDHQKILKMRKFYAVDKIIEMKLRAKEIAPKKIHIKGDDDSHH